MYYFENLQWFVAVYTGLVAATYTCLLINGFVGFQFAEDGTPLSLWVCQSFTECRVPDRYTLTAYLSSFCVSHV